MNENMNNITQNFPTVTKIFSKKKKDSFMKKKIAFKAFWKTYGITLLFSIAILANVGLFFLLTQHVVYASNHGDPTSLRFFLNNHQISSFTAFVLSSIKPFTMFIIYGSASILAIITSIVFCWRTKKFYAVFVSFIFFTFVLIWVLWNYSLAGYYQPLR